jgi:hypothetical protein
MFLERWKMSGSNNAPCSDDPDSQFMVASLRHGLVLCNRYGLPIAEKSLGEFQEASEAPVSFVILAERVFLGKFTQRTAARRVESRRRGMARRLRCVSLTGRKDMLASSRLGGGPF